MEPDSSAPQKRERSARDEQHRRQTHERDAAEHPGALQPIGLGVEARRAVLVDEPHEVQAVDALRYAHRLHGERERRRQEQREPRARRQRKAEPRVKRERQTPAVPRVERPARPGAQPPGGRTNGLLAVGKASHHASSVRSPRPPDKQRLRNPAREEQGSRSI